MKQCSVCHEEKATTEFGINNATKDSRLNRCIECNRTKSNESYERNNGTKEARQILQTKLYDTITDLRNQGYPLKEIANKTGLDKSSISYYLNGKRKVGMNAVRKYAKQNPDGEDG